MYASAKRTALITGLKTHAADTARIEGRFTSRVLKDGRSYHSFHEQGDDRLATQRCKWADDESVRTNQLWIRNRKNGRVMHSIKLPDTASGVYRGGSGYGVFYERRGKRKRSALHADPRRGD